MYSGLQAEAVLEQAVGDTLPRDEGVEALLGSLRRGPRHAPDAAEAARLAGRSRSAFYREFKAWTAWTWGQFVRRWRLLEGQRRLLDPLVKRGAIAREVGYGSWRAFARAYLAHFGCPPRRAGWLF